MVLEGFYIVTIQAWSKKRKVNESEMNVIQVSPAYPPATGYGGGPAVCKEISGELAKRGNSISIYTTTADKHKSTISEKNTNENGIEIYRSPLVNNWITYKFKLFLIRGFRKNLKKARSPDLIHIHDLRTPLSVAAVREAQDRGIPTVMQPHGTVPRKNRLVFLKWLFDSIWGKEVFNSVSHWFALNSEEAQALVNQGVNKRDISIIPNAINLDSVPKPKSGMFRDAFDISPSKRIILYLGRLHQSKRIDILIDAIHELDDDDSILIIAGSDDGDETRLKRKCSRLELDDEIRFVGRVSENEKWLAYQDADLFVTPSFYGFPLTFLEAMSQQTPILTSSLGDTIEESANNGVFVLDGTVESLATKIDELLSDVEKLDAAGQSAYERVKNEYTWENVVDKIEKKYSEL